MTEVVYETEKDQERHSDKNAWKSDLLRSMSVEPCFWYAIYLGEIN